LLVQFALTALSMSITPVTSCDEKKGGKIKEETNEIEMSQWVTKGKNNDDDDDDDDDD